MCKVNKYFLLQLATTGSGGCKGGVEVKECGAHKRRHCLYFLAGHCPRGPDCVEYHSVAPDNYDDLEAMVWLPTVLNYDNSLTPDILWPFHENVLPLSFCYLGHVLVAAISGLVQPLHSTCSIQCCKL